MSFPTLPYLGAGLSYRWALNKDILNHRSRIDWLEISPEHFLPFQEEVGARLELLARHFPIAGHGLELSWGSNRPDEPTYLEGLERTFSAARAVWHGDHACFTRTHTRSLRGLTPIPCVEEAAELTVRNIRASQTRLKLPLVLENIAVGFQYAHQTLEEPVFLTQVTRDADCGWLLDLHNLHANAINFGVDPYRFLDQAPLDRVVQIHLAGGHAWQGFYLDSHARRTPEEVWRMLEYVVPRCPVRGVNLEWDADFPPFDILLEELDRARSILNAHGASGA